MFREKGYTEILGKSVHIGTYRITLQMAMDPLDGNRSPIDRPDPVASRPDYVVSISQEGEGQEKRKSKRVKQKFLPFI